MNVQEITFMASGAVLITVGLVLFVLWSLRSKGDFKIRGHGWELILPSSLLLIFLGIFAFMLPFPDVNPLRMYFGSSSSPTATPPSVPTPDPTASSEETPAPTATIAVPTLTPEPMPPTPTLVFTPTPQASEFSLTPEADVYVQGGDYSHRNFGTDSQEMLRLVVKTGRVDSDTRHAVLRWDLAPVSGYVIGARVMLCVRSAGAADGLRNVAVLVPNNDWGETTTTWDNAPELNTKPIASWTPVTERWVEFDVTPQLQDALNDDRKLSLGIHSPEFVGFEGWVNYNSKEAHAGVRPRLVITVSSSSDAPVPTPIPVRTSTPCG